MNVFRSPASFSDSALYDAVTGTVVTCPVGLVTVALLTKRKNPVLVLAVIDPVENLVSWSMSEV